LSFNYFFIPPLRTFQIHFAQDWVAFLVFLGTAVAVGQLSSREKLKAQQAESRRVRIEELYVQLQKVFEQASEAETLRRSEKLKTALLDAVTHDLRTPLTSIKASATALLDEDQASLTSEGARELLTIINEESDHLNRFVEEMMSVAKIEGGHLLLHPSPTSAEEIVDQVLDRANNLLQGKQVEVSIESKLPLLLVDAGLLSQALYEVVENAAKYTAVGGHIHVTARRGNDDKVAVSVENEGSVVPAEMREKVFEKFFRGSKKEREHGFGMGLAIAKGIVEAHGGRIWMEAPPGNRGTVVRFTVPAKAEPNG
jgi:two-component system sensor histidine kinase KdpD